MEAYADSVVHYIAEQRLSNYIVVEHGMGGKIALFLAARQPAGLRGLALLSSSPPSSEPMTDEERTASYTPTATLRQLLRRWRAITARPLTKTVQAQVIEDNLRTTRAAWDAWLLHSSRENILLALMPLITVPAVVLAGDAVMSPSLHGLETLPHLPPNMSLEIIGGADYLLPLEAPQEVAVLLREFVESLM